MSVSQIQSLIRYLDIHMSSLGGVADILSSQYISHFERTTKSKLGLGCDLGRLEIDIFIMK